MRRVLGWLAGVALIASPASAASVDITQLSARVVGDEVRIEGAATFADAPWHVGTDAPLDAPPVAGTDLVAATIARPTAELLVFRFELADTPPADGTPVTVYYNWSIAVTNASGTKEYTLQANRAPAARLPSTQPVFRIVCAPSCTKAAYITGRMEHGAVEWHVPAWMIGATPGARIARGSTGAGTTFGAGYPAFNGGGDTWLNAFVDEIAPAEYVVPGETVFVSLEREGHPPVIAWPATVTDGRFSRAVPMPPPGEYVLRAIACYRDGEACASRSLPLTV